MLPAPRFAVAHSFALVAVLSLSLVGCKSDDAGYAADGSYEPADYMASQPEPMAIVPAEPVAVFESISGNDPALTEPMARMVTSRGELDAIGSAELSAMPIDFDANDLVVVALGEHPTGGYAVEIEDVLLEGQTLVVIGKALVPDSGAILTQAMTYPYAVAIVGKTGAADLHVDLRP